MVPARAELAGHIPRADQCGGGDMAMIGGAQQIQPGLQMIRGIPRLPVQQHRQQILGVRIVLIRRAAEPGQRLLGVRA